MIAYRVTRAPSMRERAERVLPLDWLHEMSHRFDPRRGIPNIRLYVGDRAIGESPPETTVERIVVRAAQAAGTAAAAAVVSRLMMRFRGRSKQA